MEINYIQNLNFLSENFREFPSKILWKAGVLADLSHAWCEAGVEDDQPCCRTHPPGRECTAPCPSHRSETPPVHTPTIC